MQGIDLIFSIAVLIFSVVIHEVSHGYMAYYLGDPTAKYAGRLTVNPLKHLELFGSVIVPLITSLSGFVFGWAKPVPYNPYNLKKPRRDEVLVALAGPVSNIAIASIFSALIRYSVASGIATESFISIAGQIVAINLVLAVFNMVPIPPLDGSKLLFSFLPPTHGHIREYLERYGFILLILFILFLWEAVVPLVFNLFRLLTGL
jgi:Zn-dependent protease